MKAQTRRQVLSGMAALAASTVASSAAVAETEKTAAAGPFLVRTEESRGDGPWVIQGKDPISTKVSAADVSGRYAIMELDTPPGRGPALHIHSAQNEWFFLLRGSIGIQCGKEKIVLEVGDSFMAPMGIPHAYVTLGTETARILNVFDPAGEIEAFFKEYVSLLNKPGPPDAKSLNAASERHGIPVVGPPLHPPDFAGY